MRHPEDSLGEFIDTAVSNYGSSIAERFHAVLTGEPEEQLRGPTEVLIHEIATAMGRSIVLTGEVGVSDLRSRPDYGVLVDGALTGHIELKAPGTGVDTARFTGHNREQWGRLRPLPNLIFSTVMETAGRCTAMASVSVPSFVWTGTCVKMAPRSPQETVAS